MVTTIVFIQFKGLKIIYLNFKILK